MNHFDRYRQQLSGRIFLAIFVPAVTGVGTYIACRELLGMELLWAGVATVAILSGSISAAWALLLSGSTKPLGMVWQAVWHVSPDKSNVPPPNPQQIALGRELVSSLISQVYELAGSRPLPVPAATPTATTAQAPAMAPSFLESVPLPLFVLDKNWAVKAVNAAASSYLGQERDAVVGKSIHDVLHLSFSSDDTLDGWLAQARANKATDSRSWEHVRLEAGDTVKQLDLAASYSRDQPDGNEAVLVLFDRTSSYSSEDKATSYVAMAVHELRTPLTMLRGYIEMFEDELGPTLSEEHQAFMRKMSASSQRLAAFVANILNVARIDGNEFVVNLQEADWGEVLREIVAGLELRAQVRGKRLQLTIAENLPTVGVDKLSVHEVVSNLVENAIKYGGQNPDIIISTQVGKDGLIETTVQDFGIGMPASVIGGLFTKFYRSHRSKNAVGGNGLGLYIVKSIVTAHGGNVWVNSHEGEGSTFGFSLVPYANLKQDAVGNPDGIERHANGWIKNHSLYRR